MVSGRGVVDESKSVRVSVEVKWETAGWLWGSTRKRDRKRLLVFDRSWESGAVEVVKS